MRRKISAFNELIAAKQVADHFETDHTEARLRPDATALLPKVVEAMAEPFADSSAIPTYLLCEVAQTHGDGRLVGNRWRRTVWRVSAVSWNEDRGPLCSCAFGYSLSRRPRRRFLDTRRSRRARLCRPCKTLSRSRVSITRSTIFAVDLVSS